MKNGILLIILFSALLFAINGQNLFYKNILKHSYNGVNSNLYYYNYDKANTLFYNCHAYDKEDAGHQKFSHYEFLLKFQGKTYDLIYDSSNSVAQNFMIQNKQHMWGRDGNHKEAVFALNTLINMGIRPSSAFEFVFPSINANIDNILNKINILPKDSKVIFTPNFSQKFLITKEKCGYIIDKEKLFMDIFEKFLDGPQVSIDLHYDKVEPSTTRRQGVERTKLLSSFVTSIATSSTDRQNNVKLALKQFNGMCVEPNQEISFNAVTGRRTTSKGYKEAHIILDGLFVDGLGGGVCQSSTTLYNALLMADNVKILEANRHSMPVSYVKLGFDAMVAYGSSDLKFKNIGDTPIYIRTFCKNQNVGVEIYGKQNNSFEKKRRTEIIKNIKSKGDIVKNDNGEFSEFMNENGLYRQKKSKDGMEVQTYLDYYENGKLIKSQKIRHTIYPAQQGILYKGKKKNMPLLEKDVNDYI